MLVNRILSWAVKTAAGAIIGGVCWKLGADVYEGAKERLSRRKAKPSAEDEAAAEAGPIQTHTVGAENNGGTAPAAGR
jgi:hypothetical protein